MSLAECPNCGAELPSRARVCPECGSDERTGWSEDVAYDDLNLPGEDFDYDDFVEREFGAEGPLPRGIHPFWWGVAVLMVILGVWFWII